MDLALTNQQRSMSHITPPKKKLKQLNAIVVHTSTFLCGGKYLSV